MTRLQYDYRGRGSVILEAQSKAAKIQGHPASGRWSSTSLSADRRYNAETLEYQIQSGNEEAGVEWVLGIYLDSLNPPALDD
jgi:hypothetical protein